MANPVDSVIGSEAIKQVQQLKKQLEDAVLSMIDLSTEAQKAGKNISNISTPKGFNDSLASNAKLSQELDKQNAVIASLKKQIQDLVIANQKLSIQSSSTTKSVNNTTNASRQSAVANQILRAETDRNIRATTLLGGAYARASAQLLVLKKEAKDLAIAFGEDSVQAKRAAQAALELDGRIKAVDKSVGDSQRNVGNYSSAFTRGLSGAWSTVRQLAYILPGLGVAGILGFAVEPITNYVKSLGFVKQLLGEVKTSQQELNDVNVTAKKNAIEETVNLKSLLEIAKDTSLSYKDRLIAVKELQKTYPSYFDNLSTEKILAGDTALAEKELTEAILSRAKAQAATSKITENQSKIIDLEEKRLDVTKRLSAAQAQVASAEKIRNSGATIGGSIAGTYDVAFVAINKVAEATSDLADIDKEINDLQDINNRLSGYAIENNKKSIRLKQEETKVKKESNKKDKDKIQALNLEGVAVGTTIEQIDKYIDALQTELNLNADNEEAYNNIKTALEQVKKAKTDLITGGGEIISTANLKEVSTAVKEVSVQLTKLQEQYLSSFTSEFFQNSGFSETFALLNDEVDGFGENFAVTFNAIAESAQEAFNFISNASQNRFDAEKNRLQDQYDVAIGFANGNKAAEEKLANDLEKRKKEIANREAKAKQKQAIFNIAIDTAQAIMGLWAKPGFPAAIPLAIAVGALGAAQIGIVAAQKIPQYAEGTDNHSGGLMLVNDAKGSSYQEKVIFPNGKEFIPQGRNVLMDAPAGTKVLTPEQQLMEALNGTNIKLSKETINRSQGMTAEQMDYVLGKHFGNITTNTTIFDENGMRTWSERNGNKTIQTSNRVTRTGIRV